MKRLVYLRAVVGVLAAVAVSLAAPAAASAALMTLKDLATQDGSIKVGDKLFTNFEVTTSGEGNFISDPALIHVEAAPAPGDFGIQFLGPIVAFADGSVRSSIAHMHIAFDVTVVDQPLLIKDIGLSFNGIGVANHGSSLASVTETAFAGQALVGQAEVNSLNPPFSLSKKIDLAGAYHKIRVEKDIIVYANVNTPPPQALLPLPGGAYAFSKISLIEQRFSQVPEPATLALLGLGAVVLFRGRRAY